MTKNILQHLRIEEQPPGLAYLQELMTAYCKIVPWESVSKIVKKANCKDPQTCVRSEEEYWKQSFAFGTGGTCYESNWAFYKLLKSLGFDSYLTINNIADKSSVHSAIIVTIDDSKFIVDVGYPLYAPVPIIQKNIAQADHPLIQYRSTFIAANEYLIENFPHPKPYLYHLTDIPVTEIDYLNVAMTDYCDTGLFLDRIIIRKMIDNTPTRFDSEDFPYNIHELKNGAKTRHDIPEGKLLETLSHYFQMDIDLIRNAFELIKPGSYKPDFLRY